MILQEAEHLGRLQSYYDFESSVSTNMTLMGDPLVEW